MPQVYVRIHLGLQMFKLRANTKMQLYYNEVLHSQHFDEAYVNKC